MGERAEMSLPVTRRAGERCHVAVGSDATPTVSAVESKATGIETVIAKARIHLPVYGIVAFR